MYTTSYADRLLRSERVHTELKRRLLRGDYPAGARLVEERLAAALDVSRTPVREALFRLHAEGLIQRVADGGFAPTLPDVAGMRDLYAVREGLELLGLQLPARAGGTHDYDRLVQLRDEWVELSDDDDPEPTPEFVLLDEGFHLGLAEAAGNPALVELLRQVNERIRVVRMQDFLSGDRIVRTIEEHIAIVDAAIDGDLALAERRFLEHLDRSKSVVSDNVDRAIARMMSTTP